MVVISPFDYSIYSFPTRVTVIICSLFELIRIFGSLEEASFFAKIFYFLLAGISVISSVYNIGMNTDGRDEIRKVVGNPDNETRGMSVLLVLSPSVTGIILFLSVSGDFIFSFFVFIHVLISITQLGIEAYEVRNGCQDEPRSVTAKSKLWDFEPLSPKI
uniref:AA_permease domain-containing protein n=1 Tax=Caenorhabditis tropicalis TaxID=1561998 RepID=A0A1I7TJZ4_9PELO